MKKPKIKLRIVFTVLLVIAWFTTVQIYQTAQGPIESSIAVQQLEDSKATYAVGRAGAMSYIPKIINWTGSVLLLLMWLPYGIKFVRYSIRDEGKGK